MSHDKIEKNVGLMVILIVVAISFGGLAEIVPLFFQKQTTQPIEGLKPLTALELEGRDVYIAEGCSLCHSQMVRPLLSETERYGEYSVAGEDVYEHPFLWGAHRTGPDLARVGGRYTDEWHRIHLINPRDLVPSSIMPGYPWLENNMIKPESPARKMRALRRVGVPYTDEDIEGASKLVLNKTEMDALIAYLQQLGNARRNAARG